MQLRPPPSAVNHLGHLYFLHIPKTAGTSFRTWLQEFYPRNSTQPASHLAELEDLADDQLQRYRFASGHFGWRYVERAERTGIPVKPLTFLRDPVDLSYSSLRFAGRLSDEDLGRLASHGDVVADIVKISREIAEGMELEAALARLFLPKYEPMWNVMVRCLADAGTEAPHLTPLQKVDLDLAKRRLESMPFFGLVEEMEWSGVLFADAFGLPHDPITVRANVGGGERGSQLSPELAGQFRQLHAFDAELFQFGRALFARRVTEVHARYGVSPDAGPAELTAPLMRRFLKSRYDIAALSDSEISLGDGVICSGFQRCFHWNDMRRWVRWSGPDTNSTVCLPLDRTRPRAVELEFLAFLSDGIRDGLRISCGGALLPAEIRYERKPNGSYALLATVVVPPDLNAASYTAIDFAVPTTIRASGLPEPASFALGNIKIGLAAQA